MKKSFGSFIRERRKVVGLTAEELGRKAGVNRTYISKIENGVMLPSRRIALALKIILGLGNKFMQAYYKAKYPEIVASLKADIAYFKKVERELSK